LVKANEKMLGMHHYDDGAGGFSSFGMLTEHGDSELFKKFKKVARTAGFARYYRYSRLGQRVVVRGDQVP
jgi:hypothetical protein